MISAFPHSTARAGMWPPDSARRPRSARARNARVGACIGSYRSGHAGTKTLPGRPAGRVVSPAVV
jgi:hypothetical protein